MVVNSLADQWSSRSLPWQTRDTSESKIIREFEKINSDDHNPDTARYDPILHQCSECFVFNLFHDSLSVSPGLFLSQPVPFFTRVLLKTESAPLLVNERHASYSQ